MAVADTEVEVEEVLVVHCDVSRYRASDSRNASYSNASTRRGPQIGPLTCRMQIAGSTLEVDVLHGKTVVGSATSSVGVDQARRRSIESWEAGDDDDM
jgi:hypothetical protein